MKRLASAAATIVLALPLAGCQSDAASFLIDGRDRALTVVRTQDYPWSDWRLELVTRSDPLCQRRFRLKDVANDNVKIDLYQPAPGAYILRQGKRWYVTEIKDCGFDTYKEEPAQPGVLLGSFQIKDGKFQFIAQLKAGQGDAKPAPAGG